MSVKKTSVAEQLLTLLALKHPGPSGLPATDYRLAEIIGISRQAISRYRLGESFFEDDVAMQMAELTGLDPAYVLAMAHAERAARAESRSEKVWRRIAGLFSNAAAVLVALTLWGGPTPPALSAVVAAHASQSAIMSNRWYWRLRTLILALLAPLAWRPA